MSARPLRLLYSLLLSLARAIGRVNTFLLLCISFYGVLLPISLVRRLLRAEKQDGRPSWQPRRPLEKSHLRNQY